MTSVETAKARLPQWKKKVVDAEWKFGEAKVRVVEAEKEFREQKNAGMVFQKILFIR